MLEVEPFKSDCNDDEDFERVDIILPLKNIPLLETFPEPPFTLEVVDDPIPLISLINFKASLM